ncbi:DUF5694 domain-containing protein [Aurantiacibacter sp. MUD11]|uniref:DUF5694 domain-containing protein n=1 Tax=Aurantiacibacter sp. MUD11 TaxID=3003265 RepID=UPI0022AA723A|nr:DUF5694 domain-containing protein [Aurantiacibacter sp. MUD11]WAT18591.1 DUF5694 domain-containing protein [Aurantiacibacter sp. MUD11]
MAFTPAAALADHHETAGEDAPVEVMVLGVYHFANPGLDVINIEVDDVLVPQRQQELQAISDALAEWRPTRILLEAQPDTEDLHIPSFRENPAQRVAEDRNEHYQLGYRLALQLGHADVYGFDERGDEGEPDYFPMGEVQAYAEQHGMMDRLTALFGWAEATIGGMSADDAECSIAANLLDHNDPQWLEEGHSRLYYGMLPFGDAEDQPGAELNAYWFMRNAKMFAKVGLIAEPGDRVLIIVGSGHKYWLDHLVRNTPGYASIDPRPYLEAADDGRCS